MLRTAGPRLAAVLTLASVWILGPAPPADAAASLQVTAGYDGAFVPGRSVPVRVRTQTDRSARGRLEVDVGNAGAFGLSRVRLPVDLPAGSTREHVVVAPGAPSFSAGGLGVEVRLVGGDGGVLARRRTTIQPARATHLVGLFPGVLGAGRPPDPVLLPVTAGLARFVPIDAGLAGQPGALDALATLGLAPGELAGLTPSARGAVLRWVGAGGHLLVDAAPGTDVEGLPAEWAPSPYEWSQAGQGRVRLTGGAMAAGLWTGLIDPAPVHDPNGSDIGFDGDRSIGNDLAEESGFRVPKLGWLLVFLLGYTAVVGPLTYLVLARLRRAELAWVVIPVVAVVFTAGSYVGAMGLRSGVRVAHATAVELGPGGAVATTYVGLVRRTGSTVEVGFGDGWQAWSGPRRSPRRADRPSTVELGERGMRLRLPVSAGEFAVAAGHGPVRAEGALSIDASSDADGRARGTIRSTLPFVLEDAAVFVGNQGFAIAPLRPGEVRQWSLDGSTSFAPLEAGPEQAIWGSGVSGYVDSDRPPRVTEHDIVSLPLWEALQSSGHGRVPGTAVVAGWTRQHRPQVAVGDRMQQPAGRTVFLARSPVRPAGRLTDLSVPGRIVQGRGVTGTDSLVVGFSLPAGYAPTRPLRVRIPFGTSTVEAWAADQWVVLASGVPASGAAQARTSRYEVPVEAVHRGQVFVRIRGGGLSEQRIGSLVALSEAP